jgi:hypothetical protein
VKHGIVVLERVIAVMISKRSLWSKLRRIYLAYEREFGSRYQWQRSKRIVSEVHPMTYEK